MLDAAYAPLVAFAAALILVWQLTYGRLARLAVDHPNERSLHKMPIPRSGGLGLHAGILLSWPFSGMVLPAVVVVSLGILFVISMVDDVRGLPIVARLAAHVLAAGAVSTYLLPPEFDVAVKIVVALSLVWMINLYNFMDGADGLAGGMALFGFLTYSVAALDSGHTAFALFNLCIASAAAAFLAFNFHPARIFMGDAGAVPLGFLAGCLGLIGWLQKDWAWWFPLLVFSPFIVDASVTLIRRAWARTAIWQAHRDHYYQRLVRLGWGHRRTALTEYALMILCGGAALLGLQWPPSDQLALLAGAIASYAALIISVEIAWRNHQHERSHDA